MNKSPFIHFFDVYFYLLPFPRSSFCSCYHTSSNPPNPIHPTFPLSTSFSAVYPHSHTKATYTPNLRHLSCPHLRSAHHLFHYPGPILGLGISRGKKNKTLAFSCFSIAHNSNNNNNNNNNSSHPLSNHDFTKRYLSSPPFICLRISKSQNPKPRLKPGSEKYDKKRKKGEGGKGEGGKGKSKRKRRGKRSERERKRESKRTCHDVRSNCSSNGLILPLVLYGF